MSEEGKAIGMGGVGEAGSLLASIFLCVEQSKEGIDPDALTGARIAAETLSTR